MEGVCSLGFTRERKGRRGEGGTACRDSKTLGFDRGRW